MIRSARTLALVAAVGAATAASGQFRSEPPFGTGAVLPPPETYDAAPNQPMFRAAVPVRVDLTPFAPKPDTQGQQGSCAAWATTYAARTILGTMQGKAREATFSPALTFNLGKRLQAAKYGNTSMDCQSGMMIPVALDLLRDSGAVPWSQFPYDANSCDRLPTQAETSVAAQARIGGWETLATRDAVRQALAQSRPVVFSMSVGPQFYGWSGPGIYRVTTRAANDGLHAMTIIGYDDEVGAFRVINSWGTHWGDNGYFWLSYDSFDALATWQGRLQAFSVIPQQAPVKPVIETVEEADPEIELAAIRNAMTCGDIGWSKAGGNYTVSGYVGNAAEKAVITKAVLKAAPGARVTLEELPWPQCEVRRRLTNFSGGVRLALNANGKSTLPGQTAVQLREGDFFALDAAVDPATPHLTIVYIQADGTAVPLYNGKPQRGTVQLGTGANMFRVTGPFGPEAVVAVASDDAVFRNLPASGVAERAFLDMLNRQLMEATQKQRPVKVASLLVKTTGI